MSPSRKPLASRALYAMPLLLAAWAALERCGRPSDSLPGHVAASGVTPASGAPPASSAPPCPADTLPDRGLCLPIPASGAAALDQQAP